MTIAVNEINFPMTTNKELKIRTNKKYTGPYRWREMHTYHMRERQRKNIKTCCIQQ